MCNFVCAIVTAVIGCILVIGTSLISFLLVPDLVKSIIKNEVLLKDDTIQYERFEEIPFALEFRINVFEISNPEEVLNGHVPIMKEVGPYVYKIYQGRNISYAEGDILRYRRLEYFEFNAEASYPLTEDDMLTIINVPYHAIIQIAEMRFPQLMLPLNMALSSVFGEHNSPIMTVRAGDLFFDGITICKNPGFIGTVACEVISVIGASAQNLADQDDGSLVFSLLDYKNAKPSFEFEVHRGLEDSDQLGLVRLFGGSDYFSYWVNDSEDNPSVCNMINGTDSGIIPPFIDKEKPIYAMNTDICRTVDLRYQYDVEVEGIPTYHFSANEWLLSNEDGCYCLNVTQGINRSDGCLLPGAMELYSCVGAMLVLTYPHFLYADLRYRNGVVGMAPDVQKHRIFLEVEPNTGTPIRAAKRAQFNIFQRPISGVPSTNNLRTVLVPIVWIEEWIDIPEEFKDELRSRLLFPLSLLDIFIPVLIAGSGLVLLVGLACVWRAKRAKNTMPPAMSQTDLVLDNKTQ